LHVLSSPTPHSLSMSSPPPLPTPSPCPLLPHSPLSLHVLSSSLHLSVPSSPLPLVPDSDEAASGPSDLIFTRGNVEDDEEAEDSDTDDIDHAVAEERLEEPAFQNFLQQTQSKYREKIGK
ncbi:hypothetical protein FKM82_020171, partial [Ascaphus truei]